MTTCKNPNYRRKVVMCGSDATNTICTNCGRPPYEHEEYKKEKMNSIYPEVAEKEHLKEFDANQLPLFDESLEEQVERLMIRLAPHEAEVKRIWEIIHDLKKQCECPEEWREEKSWFDSGDYLNQACTTTVIKCRFCGKEFSRKEKSHGYYG